MLAFQNYVMAFIHAAWLAIFVPHWSISIKFGKFSWFTKSSFVNETSWLFKFGLIDPRDKGTFVFKREWINGHWLAFISSLVTIILDQFVRFKKCSCAATNESQAFTRWKLTERSSFSSFGISSLMFPVEVSTIKTLSSASCSSTFFNVATSSISKKSSTFSSIRRQRRR